MSLAKRLAAQADDASWGLISLLQSIRMWGQGGDEMKLGGGWWGGMGAFGYFGQLLSRQSLQSENQVWGKGESAKGALGWGEEVRGDD